MQLSRGKPQGSVVKKRRTNVDFACSPWTPVNDMVGGEGAGWHITKPFLSC